jgi:hypothetical protein
VSRFLVRKVAVLGAGVMGAQIAAHLVNLKLPVVLFDLPAKEGPKNGIVSRAIDGLKKLKPAPLGVAEDAALIQQANYEEHLDLLLGCDLIIEAIAERMDWKLDLYKKIAPFVAPHAIVASNTSGLSITKLAEVLWRGCFAEISLLRSAHGSSAGRSFQHAASSGSDLADRSGRGDGRVSTNSSGGGNVATIHRRATDATCFFSGEVREVPPPDGTCIIGGGETLERRFRVSLAATIAAAPTVDDAPARRPLHHPAGRAVRQAGAGDTGGRAAPSCRRVRADIAADVAAPSRRPEVDAAARNRNAPPHGPQSGRGRCGRRWRR